MHKFYCGFLFYLLGLTKERAIWQQNQERRDAVWALLTDKNRGGETPPLQYWIL